MALIVALLAEVLCAAAYVRMVKREIPEPIGVKKALVPVGFGALAIFVNLPVMILFGLVIQKTVGSIAQAVPSLLLRSLVSSFFLAGFTEELVKFLMFLLVLKIDKPKNVYEYGMLCAGVGVGFTALEELLYSGSALPAMVLRLLFFGMHVLFGLLMGTELGLAKYCSRTGRGGVGKHRFLAFFLPVLWHTVFDAATTANAAANSTEKSVQIAGIVCAGVVCVISIVLQFALLIRFRKKTGETCAMLLTEPEPADAPEKGEEQT